MTMTRGTFEAVEGQAMTIEATSHEERRAPRGGPFTYASGARPLDGYTIRRGVGHGGFGEVYYATSDGGKEVALKLLRRNYEVELRGVRQCLNLKHANLLAVHDIRQDQHGDHWIVMEYITGESLEQALARHPRGMPRDVVLTWLRGIAAGVAHLHDHGIVHRDLKPANLFMDDGVVKIGDYGLSKFISASRRSGQTDSVGTVHYMAPEIAGGRYGKEIDIYALGVILYEMLTGKVPFDGESVGEILMKHLTATADVSIIEEPYRAVVRRALWKDVTHRTRSVAEMVADLPIALASGAQAGAATRAHESPPPPVRGHERGRARRARDHWSKHARGPWGKCGPRGTRGAQTECGSTWMLVTSILLYSVAVPIAFAMLAPVLGMLAIAAATVLMVKFSTSVSRRPRRDASASKPPATTAAPSPPRSASVGNPPYYPHNDRPKPKFGWSAAGGSKAREALVVGTRRERFTELVGSMFGAACVVAAACGAAFGLLRHQYEEPGPFVWVALVGTFATWVLLAIGKFWEGSDGEPLVRRLILLLAGMIVGLFAWAMNDWLLVDLHLELAPPKVAETLVASLYDHSGIPLPAVYLAYFGCLLGVPAWWRQSEPLRAARLSVWGMAWVVLVAVVVNEFWPFPQPWGGLAAGVISLAVQLASPWKRKSTGAT